LLNSFFLEEMKMKKVLLLLVVTLCCAGLAQAVNMTGLTLAGADQEGTVQYSERWNTYGAHPAWDIFVKDGAIPGNSILNLIDDVQPDRMIDIPLPVGTHTFTFGVSHGIGGDLGWEYYGLNLFFDKPLDPLDPCDPTPDQAPDISVYGMKDVDATDGVHPAFMANGAAATMGYLIADMPGTGSLVYDDGSTQITLTDWFLYAKAAGLGQDECTAHSSAGPFIPDGEPDVVGQFTLEVIPEPMTLSLLGLGGLALIRRRR
jgi:hypothetical protein